MLIDRDAAVKAIEQYGIAAIFDGRKSLDTVDDIVELMRIVRAIPAAEQATRDEVKRDLPKDFGRWIPVEERKPDTVYFELTGKRYSEAVNVLTSGHNVITAIYDGEDFIGDAAFWEAEDEVITHWTPVLLPLPEPPKGD